MTSESRDRHLANDSLLAGVGGAAVPHLLADTLPCEFWVMNRDRRYVLQSAASRRNWGDLVGRELDAVEAPRDDLNRWQENDRLALQGESVMSRYERFVGGDRRRFVTVLTPAKNDGEVVGIVGMNLDESLTIMAPGVASFDESELRGVANDVVNVLSSITGFAEFAAVAADEDEAAKHLELINREAARGAELARQLFAETQPDVSSAGVDLCAVVSELAEKLRGQLPQGTKVHLRLQDQPVVTAKRHAIEQILANLVFSSVTNSDGDAGFVQISVQGPRHDGSDASSMALLCVESDSSDDEEHVHPSTFAPFNATDHRGTGHGLWNVRHVVDGLRGALRLRTRLGLGTRCEVFLPVIAS